MRVLLGVSGGIAAYKSAEIVRRLRERGADVRCAVTRGGASFITPLTLEVLSGHPVAGESYLDASGPQSGEEGHIAAAAWADVLCVAPATTHTIARLALGLGDDFLTTTALAFAGPLVLAPAMHPVMWERETTRAHVASLRTRGATIVGPVEGPLASGETGWGRMADPAAIADAVLAAALRAAAIGPLDERTVVVTAGPTYEALDPVRFLGNRSSGKMGFALAAESHRRGARTVLIAGPVGGLPTPPGVERVDVTTALEMGQALYAAAPGADLVLMTAAVADFRPRQTARRKIKRGEGIPAIELEANPDLLAGLPAVAPGAVIVGFAAETHDLERNARAKLASKGCDFLVANDVSRDDIGFQSDDNEVTVYSRDAEPVLLGRRPKTALAADLLDLFLPALVERERRTSPVVDR